LQHPCRKITPCPQGQHVINRKIYLAVEIPPQSPSPARAPQ